MRKAALHNLGCKVNAYETEAMGQLLEEAGRLDLPGRPLSYRTTPHFLRTFGLESLEQLPPLPGTEDGTA